MTKKLLFSLFLVSLTQSSFGQYKNYFEKELAVYQSYIIANEQDVGRFMNWSKFRQKQIVTWEGKGQSTMLLGSATYLHDFLEKAYPDFKATVIKAKSQWQIRFNFNGTSIDIYKRLQLKRQWRDQFAYQKPDNYWLAYGFDQKDERLSKAISVIHYYYSQSNISYQTNINPEKLEEYVIESERNENDFASLYFYNPAPFYNNTHPGKYDVKLNDSTIYELKKDEPAIVKVHKEGNYTLSAKTAERTEIQLNIEKGRDYFIRCGIYKASFLGKPKVHLVIEDFARPEFEACMERYEIKKSKR